MNATKVLTTKVVLVLEEDEARWLQGYVQNAFTEDEEPTTTTMRALFFDAIKEAKVRNP